MKNSGTSRKKEKMAMVILLPLCIFTALLFRNPANNVAKADMPGGVSRYLNRRSDINPFSGHAYGQNPVQAFGFAAGIF